MGYWGWRPLICCVFISVWVVGCNIVSDAAPASSATPSPRVTLTLRRIATETATVPTRVTVTPATPATPATPEPLVYQTRPDETWAGIAERFGLDARALQAANGQTESTLQPGQRLSIPIPTLPSPLATSGAPTLTHPVCYETPADSLLCLGSLENTLDYAIEQAVVLVQLQQIDGLILMSEAIEIEQSIIPAGESAPYRALFQTNPRDPAEVVARLLRAQPAHAIDDRFAALIVQDAIGRLENGRYIVTATVRNPGPEHAHAVRAIVTLRADDGTVVGYRVARPRETLRAGGSVRLRVEIVPQIPDITPEYTLRVEARRPAD
jgi:LysM repeat protein